MTNDEFENLNKFAKRFDQPKEVKKEQKNKSPEKVKKERKNYLEGIKKITIYFRYISKRALNYTTRKIDKISLIRKKKYGYKIVEKRRQIINRVIIVRKRVPLSFDKKYNKKIFGSGFYYFKLNGKDDVNQNNISRHDKVKKSIWDFPIKK